MHSPRPAFVEHAGGLGEPILYPRGCDRRHDIVVDAELPAVLEESVALKVLESARDRISEAQQLPRPLRLGLVVAQERGAGAGEIVHEIDEAEARLRIRKVRA